MVDSRPNKDDRVHRAHLADPSGGETVVGRLSVLVPITERYDPVEELYHEYKRGLDNLNRDYEILFVIDGDRPDVRSALEVLGHGDTTLKVVELSRAYVPPATPFLPCRAFGR